MGKYNGTVNVWQTKVIFLKVLNLYAGIGGNRKLWSSEKIRRRWL